MINVLIACEESQTICKEFRKRGFNSYSCDLYKCSGGHPEWHFNTDCFEIINNKGGKLENSTTYYLPNNENWDLLIAHPPCTYLTVSGARWFYHPEDKHLPFNQRREHPKHIGRRALQNEAIEFFKKFTNTGIKHWCIENPVGCMSTYYRKPDQIIQPFMFGDSASKKTCLWLHNLPKLVPTKIVDKGEFVVAKSGKKMAKWYADILYNCTKEERSKLRSKTFQGIAEAIAEQFGNYLKNGFENGELF